MKRITLFAALLSVLPVAGFAQDSSTNARGNDQKSVGPASENGDTSTGNTVNPGGNGAVRRGAAFAFGAAREVPDFAWDALISGR
jgi:hypothetical protein